MSTPVERSSRQRRARMTAEERAEAAAAAEVFGHGHRLAVQVLELREQHGADPNRAG